MRALFLRYLYVFSSFHFLFIEALCKCVFVEGGVGVLGSLAEGVGRSSIEFLMPKRTTRKDGFCQQKFEVVILTIIGCKKNIDPLPSVKYDSSRCVLSMTSQYH